MKPIKYSMTQEGITLYIFTLMPFGCLANTLLLSEQIESKFEL